MLFQNEGDMFAKAEREKKMFWKQLRQFLEARDWSRIE
jgi:hypothetical protein